MSLLYFYGMLLTQAWAGEINQKYAPQFILSSFNNQTLTSRFGFSEIRLSQLVGYNSQKKIHKVFLILGDQKTVEKDIKTLKKLYGAAKKQKIEFVYLLTPNTGLSKTILRLNPQFPVLKDPFQVVRNRYEYVKPQFCYIIDVHGKLEQKGCSDINDIKSMIQ
ncbi:MAG: hypothetical protein CL916_12425 [Deltaproteobacteria bacterium]|nr:hypothetical protein [Deltaproteobacteria bacterium]